MKVRQHRGSFEESMATVESIFATEHSLAMWCSKVLVESGAAVGPSIILKLELTHQGVDIRNGWDTSTISSEGFGVIGYCDDFVVSIHDMEQNDPERITLERDLLAQAIAKMGIKMGFINTDAVLTGPHLLMLCEDITLGLKEESKYV